MGFLFLIMFSVQDIGVGAIKLNPSSQQFLVIRFHTVEFE